MPSPQDVFKSVSKPDRKYARDIERAHEEGKQEGMRLIRGEILDYLEREYRSPKVERGSNEGKAILAVTRDLSTWLKNRLAH